MPRQTRSVTATALAIAAMVLAACGGTSSPSPIPTPDPTATPRPTPTPAPTPVRTSSSSAVPTTSPTPIVSPTPAADSVIVTMRVGGMETYRVLLTDPADIAIARQLLAGEEAPTIPNGRILRDGDGGVNTGWSWHIDPASFEWAEVTTEVCDGLPSFVEDGTLTGPWFCPWSAVVTEITE
jgi:hypothetical protein